MHGFPFPAPHPGGASGTARDRTESAPPTPTATMRGVPSVPSYGAMEETYDDHYTNAEEGESLLGNAECKMNNDDDGTTKQPEYTRAGFADDLVEVEFPASPMRFVVAGLLFLSCALNCYIEYTYVAIWSIAVDAYDVGPLQINALALVFALFYVPGSITAIGLYAKYGLSSCINGSTLLNFMSCWVRFIGSALFLKSSPHAAYGIVLVGHCLAALGAPLVGNAPTRLANDWFPERERDMAVSVMTQAFSVGGGFGALFPVYQVLHPTDIPNMLFWQAVFSTFLLMASVIWVPYYPPVHAGLDAAYQAILRDGTGGSSLSDLLSQMMKDFSDMTADLTFVVLLIAFSLEVGVSWALASVVGQLVQPCGYNNTVIGIISLGSGFSGIFGSFATAWVLQNYPDSLLLMQKIILMLTATTALWILAVNQPSHFITLVIPWVAYGLASGPLLPVTLALAAEITYPIPADNSAALLFTGAIVVFFFTTIVLTSLLRMEASSTCSSLINPASILITLLVLVGAGIALPMTIGKFKRRELLGMNEGEKEPKPSDAPPVNAEPLEACSTGTNSMSNSNRSTNSNNNSNNNSKNNSNNDSNHNSSSGNHNSHTMRKNGSAGSNHSGWSAHSDGLSMKPTGTGKGTDVTGDVSDEEEYRRRRVSSIFGKYYSDSNGQSEGGPEGGHGVKSDSDREFDIGPLVDRDLQSPGWVRKKASAGSGKHGRSPGDANGSGKGKSKGKDSRDRHGDDQGGSHGLRNGQGYDDDDNGHGTVESDISSEVDSLVGGGVAGTGAEAGPGEDEKKLQGFALFVAKNL